MSEEKTLPQGWEWTMLKDICIIIMGQSPPSSEYNESGKGLPFFQGKAEFTDLFPITRKWCTAPMKIAEENDILLSIRAPVGPTNLAPSQCSIGRGLAAIRSEKGVEVRYVLYAIRTFSTSLTQLATGTTFEAILGDDVRSFEIPLAPSSEQQRIVSAIEEQFTRLDAAITALQQDRARLKRARASVLKAAVEGKLTEAWRDAYPETETAEELLARILKERRERWEAELRAKGKGPAKVKYVEPAEPDMEGLPNLPEGWCWATVEQISDIIGGVTKGRNLTGRVVIELPYLRVANVQRNFLDLSVIKTIEVPQDEVDKYLLHDGDVVMTEGGDADKLGRAALWQNQISRCIHQNHIFRTRMILKDMQPLWLVFYANSEQGQAYFLNAAKQTVNLASINLTQLRYCPIPLPPLAEQQQIVAEVERRLSVIAQAEAAIEASLKRAERARQSILQRAFAGQLVPQNPDDEPASVLLERIREERERRERNAGRKTNRKNVQEAMRVAEIPTPTEIDAEEMQQVELW